SLSRRSHAVASLDRARRIFAPRAQHSRFLQSCHHVGHAPPTLLPRRRGCYTIATRRDSSAIMLERDKWPHPRCRSSICSP
ncbi:hypothetical protein Ctob_012401, partial [Chrysochromulina tobinii]